MIQDTERWAAALLAAATAVFIIATGSAVLLNPTWDPVGGALSDLGAGGSDHAWVFNGGLVLTGLLGAVGAALLRSGSERAIASLGFVLLIGVGLFPMGTALHAPTAIAFFLVETVGLLAIGRRRQATSAVLGTGLGAAGGLAALVLIPGAAVGELVWIGGFVAAYVGILLRGNAR